MLRAWQCFKGDIAHLTVYLIDVKDLTAAGHSMLEDLYVFSNENAPDNILLLDSKLLFIYVVSALIFV